MTHSRPAGARAADEPRPGAAPRPRAELRRRPEHRAAHRPPRRRRPGRPRRRDRRRARLADARARRDRARRSPPSRSTAASPPCCARSSPASPRVTVVEADAMTLDWPALLGDATGWVLVANLPYNVATPLVRDLLDGVPAIERMLVMVQREVGERLVAAPRLGGLRRGQREGGVLGVGPPRRRSCRRRCSCPARTSSRRSSRSSAARRPTSRPTSCSTLVRTAFGQRRKMLRRSLAGVVDAGDVRRRRRRRDGAARGARPRRLGPPDARGACPRDRRARPGQADADAARSPASAPTATTCSTPRW